jgi:hypothetical protein
MKRLVLGQRQVLGLRAQSPPQEGAVPIHPLEVGDGSLKRNRA